MSKKNEKWTDEDENFLKKLSKTKTTKEIAKQLERTEEAIRQKASELKISLKPKD